MKVKNWGSVVIGLFFGLFTVGGVVGCGVTGDTSQESPPVVTDDFFADTEDESNDSESGGDTGAEDEGESENESAVDDDTEEDNIESEMESEEASDPVVPGTDESSGDESSDDGDAENDDDSELESDDESGDDEESDEDEDEEDDAEADSGEEEDDADGTDTGEICSTLNVPIEPRPVKMMILQDISASMEADDKWIKAQSALSTLLTSFESDIKFGFDVFPNMEPCGVDDPIYMDTELNNAQNIIDMFDSVTLTLGTPLYKAMENLLDEGYAPDFSLPDMERYLLVVSDGGDTCYTADDWILEMDGTISSAATPEQLGLLTEELYLVDVKTFVIGFGLGDSANEDGDSLNAIAEAGGMLTEYIEVENEEELTTALTDIGASVVPCTYDIGEQDEEEVNLDLVNVYFNEVEAVPLDEGCAQNQGWSWTDETRTALMFCEQACAALQMGNITDIGIKIMCNIQDIIML